MFPKSTNSTFYLEVLIDTMGHSLVFVRRIVQTTLTNNTLKRLANIQPKIVLYMSRYGKPVWRTSLAIYASAHGIHIT